MKKIEEWLVDLGLPTNLKEFNIKEDQFQTIEDYALEDPCCPLNPKKVKKGDVVQIIRNLV